MSKLDAAPTHRRGRFAGRAESRPTKPATFTGLATLTTSRPDLLGPFSRPVRADLLIDRRGRITVTAVHVEPAQLGSVTCVISLLPGTGRGRYTAGKLQLVLGLLFRIDVLPDADSDISFTLATDPRMPRTEPDGRIGASGTATFQKGYLGGRWGTLVVTGAITPQTISPTP